MTDKLDGHEIEEVLRVFYTSDGPVGLGGIDHLKVLRGTVSGKNLRDLDRIMSSLLSQRAPFRQAKLVREQRSQARAIRLGTDEEERLRKDMRHQTGNLSETEAAAILGRFYVGPWPSGQSAIEHIRVLRGSLIGPELHALASAINH